MITTLPLFPLKLVLFPGGVLPLSIFEKRYVDMVRNCLRNNSGFVIVADLTDEEAHTEESSPFQMPYQLDSGTWLANRWSEILSIPLDEKQSLLVLDNPLTRLTLINEMLTQGKADDHSFN